MFAELLFERGRPGDELEAEAIVQHGETAGGESEPLAICAGDILAAARAIEWSAGLSGELIANGFQFMLSGEYWISFFPGLTLLAAIVAINLVGDRLREVLDPRALR